MALAALGVPYEVVATAEIEPNVIISVLNFLEEISEFVPEIRNVVGLYDKHNTNANAISISGKTLAEIRGFENEREFIEDR